MILAQILPVFELHSSVSKKRHAHHLSTAGLARDFTCPRRLPAAPYRASEHYNSSLTEPACRPIFLLRLTNAQPTVSGSEVIPSEMPQRVTKNIACARKESHSSYQPLSHQTWEILSESRSLCAKLSKEFHEIHFVF